MDLCYLFIVFAFPTFWTPELRNKKHGPQSKTLREFSSLDTAPKVWKPKSRSKNLGFHVVYSLPPCLCLTDD